MTMDRRSFLKGAAIASAGVAGLSLAGEYAVAEPTNNDRTRAATWKRSPCQLCSVGCSLLVQVENGRAVGVKGDPDSPVNRGLACVKGYHYVQALYGSDRLTHALVRREGKLVPIAMTAALDLLSNTLRDTVQRHGKDSVALYGPQRWSSVDAFAGAKLFRDMVGTSNISSADCIESSGAMAALQATFGTEGAPGCHDDIDNADVFVLWNSNLAETDPVLFSRMLERRRTNPAVRIIALTTRATRTSYASDQTVLHHTGTELAIANAIAQDIVARRLMQRDFVDRHVAFKRGDTAALIQPNAPLVAEVPRDATWKDYVEFLDAYAAERVAGVTGVPAETVRWLASQYADPSKKVMSVWGEGVNQQARSMWINSAIYNVHLLVGKIASPGNSATCLDAAASGGARADLAGTAQPRDAISMFNALERGDVRFMWIHSADPFSDLPNAQRYAHAAAQDGRFIVASAAYPTPTTDIADLVLPTALWIEHEDVVVNSERRAQRVEAMVPAPGDATSAAWQIIEVARRLGYTQQFPYDRASYVERLWEELAQNRRSGSGGPAATNSGLSGGSRALPTMAELRAAGALWPNVNGRETKWRYNTACDAAANRAQGTHDFYGHADHRAWIWLRAYEQGTEVADRAYPFVLESGCVLEHADTGAITRRIPVLNRAVPHAYVELNKQDAAKLGIGNGQMVRITSRRGSLDIEARVDYRSQPAPGHIFVPDFDERAPIRALMRDVRCPNSGQPDSSVCAVRVERITSASAP